MPSVAKDGNSLGRYPLGVISPCYRFANIICPIVFIVPQYVTGDPDLVRRLAESEALPDAGNQTYAKATEADLCAAQKTNPSITLDLENMIAYMKASNVPQPEPGPLRVEIVNASEMQKDTIVTVRRDESGALTGATAHKV